MEDSFRNNRPGAKSLPINLILGGLLILAVAVAGYFAWTKQVKPILTQAQKQVQAQYTFSFSCVVQEPIIGVYKPWLTSEFKKLNAGKVNTFAAQWVYQIACVMPEGTSVRSVTTNIKPMVNPPTPGLHFITVADTAPVATMDWMQQFQGENPKGRVWEEYLELEPFRFSLMGVYEIFLRPEYKDGKLTMNFVCHESLDVGNKPIYLCSSD